MLYHCLQTRSSGISLGPTVVLMPGFGSPPRLFLSFIIVLLVSVQLVLGKAVERSLNF